jgi:hypothetical protein
VVRGRVGSPRARDAVDGLAVDGLSVDGLSVDGLSVDGLAVDSLAVDSLAVDGLAVGGLAVDGLAVDGLSVDGLSVDGLSVDGLSVDGFSVNGLARATSRAKVHRVHAGPSVAYVPGPSAFSECIFVDAIFRTTARDGRGPCVMPSHGAEEPLEGAIARRTSFDAIRCSKALLRANVRAEKRDDTSRVWVSSNFGICQGYRTKTCCET